MFQIINRIFSSKIITKNLIVSITIVKISVLSTASKSIKESEESGAMAHCCWSLKSLF